MFGSRLLYWGERVELSHLQFVDGIVLSFFIYRRLLKYALTSVQNLEVFFSYASTLIEVVLQGLMLTIKSLKDFSSQ